VLGGTFGDEDSCFMMARSKEDSSDEEDSNSFEGDESNNGEFFNNNSNDDAEMEMDRDGDGEKVGDGEVDDGEETLHLSLAMDTRESLGTETGSSAFSAVSSPRPESAPPQLGGDGFRRLTFGNDPLTRTLQRMPVNLFG
jgi:hypothetical protein